jgi:hypothetical protein
MSLKERIKTKLEDDFRVSGDPTQNLRVGLAVCDVLAQITQEDHPHATHTIRNLRLATLSISTILNAIEPAK